MGSLKFTCNGLKIIGFDKFIKRYCFNNDLELQLDTTNGIIFADYLVKIKGNDIKIIQAKKDIERAINNYNQD